MRRLIPRLGREPLNFVLLSVLLATACASQSRADIEFEERVAACNSHCLELAMGLVERGHYAAARRPVKHAQQHAEDRSRLDVPVSDSDWRNHTFRLDVVRTVIAKHDESHAYAASPKQLWRRSASLLSDPTFDSLAGVDFHFLRKSDREWLLSTLDETKDLEPTPREQLILVLRANAQMPVDEAALRQVSEAASTVDQHVIAAHIYCAAGACGSEPALAHVAALIEDQMKVPPRSFDKALLESAQIASFLQHADPSYAKHVLWLRDALVNNVPDYAVTLPVRALGRGQACREFRTLLQTILRDPEAPYLALVDGGRCANALGKRAWGLPMLGRALEMNPHAPEGQRGLAEILMLHIFLAADASHYEQLQKSDDPGGHSATVLLAARSIAEGDLDAATKAAVDLPDIAEGWVFRGLVALRRDQLEDAAEHFARAQVHWPGPPVANLLNDTLVQLDRKEQALELARETASLESPNALWWLGRAAVLAGDRAELEALAATSSTLNKCERYSGFATAHYFLRRPQTGVAGLRAMVTNAPEPRAYHCANTILKAVELFLTPLETAEEVGGWPVSDELKEQILTKQSGCTDASLARKRRKLAKAPHNPHLQNEVAWCLAERNDFRGADAVLPDPGDGLDCNDTRARIDLGLGEVDKAIASFTELTRKVPHELTYATHLLAARLQSSTPPSVSELERETQRLALLSISARIGLFPLETLTDALEAAGHHDLAQQYLQKISARKILPSRHFRNTIEKRCADCRELFVPSALAPGESESDSK